MQRKVKKNSLGKRGLARLDFGWITERSFRAARRVSAPDVEIGGPGGEAFAHPDSGRSGPKSPNALQARADFLDPSRPGGQSCGAGVDRVRPQHEIVAMFGC